MSILFLGFVCLMAVIVVIVVGRFVGATSATVAACGLGLWFVCAGLLSYFEVIRNTTIRPPGVVLIFGPIVLFLIILVIWIFLDSGSRALLAFPLWIIIGIQIFRVVVELFLHQLWIAGVVPEMLTYKGANVDIYIGATAPIVAWIANCGRTGIKVALAWNVLGLFALANVVIRAVLTTPGPLNFMHAEIPNRMIGMFPYTYIAAFFVPLAVVLHVVALRLTANSLSKPSAIHDQD